MWFCAFVCAVGYSGAFVLNDQWCFVELTRNELILVTEIAAPLLSKEKRSEDSSVEVVRTEARDVSAEDNIQQISTSQEEQISTPEIKQISTSESKEITVSEIQQASTSEVQQRPDAGTLTLPAAPGVVEGVQIPVVVVESREDRLCFPFLWRRTTKSTQVHPGIVYFHFAFGSDSTL